MSTSPYRAPHVPIQRPPRGTNTGFLAILLLILFIVVGVYLKRGGP
ncbi:MAG TPA: hypothetical protein VGL81_34270 [Polyangiaceae bacterium]|jgi:hypothetical protein